MAAGNARPRDPARERWFWVGVGFVSALAMLVVGLVFAVSLTAREDASSVARQPAPPAPSVATAPLDLPPPPVGPAGAPQYRPLPPPPPPVVRGPAPRAPATTPQAPPVAPPAPPRVRVVERPGIPAGVLPPPPSAGGTAAGMPQVSPSSASRAASVPRARAQAGGSRQDRAGATAPQQPGAAAPGPRPGKAIAGRTARRSAPSAEAGGATPPRLLSGRDAEYPLDAMRDGVTGTVVLKAVVDPEGFVERAVVTRSSGDARLDAAAVRAVMMWRYEPARRGGVAVPGTDTATVEFFRAR